MPQSTTTDSDLNVPNFELGDSNRKLREWGVIVAVSWVLFWAIFVACKWPDVRNMPLNNLGDFLAGVFAPVAFLWLTLGYFQQGDELRQNTQALKMQANELKQSNEALKHQTELTLQSFGRLRAIGLDSQVPKVVGEQTWAAIEVYRRVGEAVKPTRWPSVAAENRREVSSCVRALGSTDKQSEYLPVRQTLVQQALARLEVRAVCQ